MAAGIDLYHPTVGFVVALVGGAMVPYLGKLLDRFKIDDVVGAVAVHMGAGAYSLIVSGILLNGYPNTGGNPSVSLWGQLVGALLFVVLGFVPGFAISWALKKAKMLRTPPDAERQGIDLSEVPATPYPEGIPITSIQSTNGNGVVTLGVKA